MSATNLHRAHTAEPDALEQTTTVQQTDGMAPILVMRARSLYWVACAPRHFAASFQFRFTLAFGVTLVVEN